MFFSTTKICSDTKVHVLLVGKTITVTMLYRRDQTKSSDCVESWRGELKNARLENAGLGLSGTVNVWNATCGIT